MNSSPRASHLIILMLHVLESSAERCALYAQGRIPVVRASCTVHEQLYYVHWQSARHMLTSSNQNHRTNT